MLARLLGGSLKKTGHFWRRGAEMLKPRVDELIVAHSWYEKLMGQFWTNFM
jgi:hypothetical protein